MRCTGNLRIKRTTLCLRTTAITFTLSFSTSSGALLPVKIYVGTVAKRRAINAYHSLTARSGHFSGESDDYLAAVSSDSDIEADHDKEETRTLLLRTINELGEPDSTIILQKYYYDRTSGEIAELLSMKASAVRMRAARALDKLKTSLSAVGITL